MAKRTIRVYRPREGGWSGVGGTYLYSNKQQRASEWSLTCRTNAQYNTITAITQLHSTENYGRRCLTPLSPHRNYNNTTCIINKQYHFMTSSDRFPLPVRSDVKSNFTNWCRQNLSKRALNALTAGLPWGRNFYPIPTPYPYPWVSPWRSSYLRQT